MNTAQRLAVATAAIALTWGPISAKEPPDNELIASGKAKFEQTCIACHKYEFTDTMIAPPAFAIQTHYKNTYGADEAAFRQAIANWAKAPAASKSIMPGAIGKFNVMPPLPLPDEDLDAIAAYLYSAAFTEACNLQGNGPAGRGQGQGKGLMQRGPGAQ